MEVEVGMVTRRQATILFVLLGLIYVAFNLLLSATGEEASDSKWVTYWGVFRLGFPIGIPAIIAVWAVFGSQRFAVRFWGALLLSVLVVLTYLWGSVHNSRYITHWDDVFGLLLTATILCLTLQSVWWWFRARRGWQIVAPLEWHATMPSNRQGWSRYVLLAWAGVLSVVMIAFWLLPIRPNFPDREHDLLQWLGDVVAMIITLTMASLSLVPIMGLILAGSRRKRFVLSTGLLLAIAAAGNAVISWEDGDQFGENFFVLCSVASGPLVCAAIPLVLMRLCGLRLYRSGDATPADTAIALESPTGIAMGSSWRFATLASGLCTLAGLVILLVILGEPKRIERVHHADLLALGLLAHHDEANRVIGYSLVDWTNPLTDEQFRIILAADRLEIVDLSRASVSNQQLERLSQFNSLRILRLNPQYKTSSVDTLTTLAAFSQVQELGLNGSTLPAPVMDAVLQLQQIQKLSLKECSLSDEAAERLLQLKNLQSIFAFKTTMSPVSVKLLCDHFGFSSEDVHVRPPNLRISAEGRTSATR